MCGDGVVTVCCLCGYCVATRFGICGDGVVTVWRHVLLVWRRCGGCYLLCLCGDAVETVVRLCGGGVATICCRCGGGVATIVFACVAAV